MIPQSNFSRCSLARVAQNGLWDFLEILKPLKCEIRYLCFSFSYNQNKLLVKIGTVEMSENS